MATRWIWVYRARECSKEKEYKQQLEIKYYAFELPGSQFCSLRLPPIRECLLCLNVGSNDMVSLGPGQALVPTRDYLEMLFGYKTDFLGWVAFILTGERFPVPPPHPKSPLFQRIVMNKYTYNILHNIVRLYEFGRSNTVLLVVQVMPSPLLLPPYWRCDFFNTKSADGSWIALVTRRCMAPYERVLYALCCFLQ